MAEPPLSEASATADIQAWMQAAILERSAVGVQARVRGDNRLAAAARLAIYADAYRLRLLECLRAEYPVLAALAGPTAFDLFALGYIAAHPSRSYTLYDYGTGFADYLDAARPMGDGTPQTVEAIPAALARIERARADVSRARGLERAGPSGAAPAGLDPVLAAMLELVGTNSAPLEKTLAEMRAPWRPDSVQLLALPFDFTATLAAAERKEAPPLPDRSASLVAVARLEYRVRCHRLEPWQYAWLEGLPGGDADMPAPATDPRVAAWLPHAAQFGLIAMR